MREIPEGGIGPLEAKTCFNDGAAMRSWCSVPMDEDQEDEVGSGRLNRGFGRVLRSKVRRVHIGAVS